jgi:hypothetical protein
LPDIASGAASVVKESAGSFEITGIEEVVVDTRLPDCHEDVGIAYTLLRVLLQNRLVIPVRIYNTRGFDPFHGGAEFLRERLSRWEPQGSWCGHAGINVFHNSIHG